MIPRLIEGPFGRAFSVTHADVGEDGHGLAPALYIVTDYRRKGLPWDQFQVGVVSLADVDGVPPANRHFPGAEWELSIFGLSPELGPVTLEVIRRARRDRRSLVLTPPNLVWQFAAATEAIAAQLAVLTVRAAVVHAFTLEPPGLAYIGDQVFAVAGLPQAWRRDWEDSLAKTLEHLRVDHHGTQGAPL